MKEFVKSHWKVFLSVIVIGLMTLILIESTQAGFFQIDQQTDPNVFKYVARIMQDGGMPYRDTFDHKGPLLYLLNFIGVSLNYNHGLWLIQSLLLVSTFIIIFATCKKVLKKSPFFSLGITILSASLLVTFREETFNIPETFVLPLIAGSAYIFFDYYINKKLSNIRLLLCGAMLGLAIMIKPNYAAIWVAFALGVIVILIRQKNTKELLRIFAIFVAGAILSALPFIIWIIANGAWTPFIDQFIKFNLLYAANPEWSNPASKTSAFLFLFNNIFIFSSIIITLLLICQKGLVKKSERNALIANLIAILIAMFITAASGQKYPHYGFAFVPLIFLPYAYVLSGLSINKQNILAIVAVLCLLGSGAIAPWSNTIVKALQNYQNRHNGQIPEEVVEIVKIINDKTTPEDKIAVVGTWDYIYNQSKRFAVSKYSYQYPISRIEPSIATEYFSDLKKSLPKIIVSHCGGDSCEKSSLPKDLEDFIIQNQYSLVYTTIYGNKVYSREL